MATSGAESLWAVAIAYGTGLVPLTAMMKCGLLLDLVSFMIIVAGLRLLCPLLGLL